MYVSGVGYCYCCCYFVYVCVCLMGDRCVDYYWLVFVAEAFFYVSDFFESPFCCYCSFWQCTSDVDVVTFFLYIKVTLKCRGLGCALVGAGSVFLWVYFVTRTHTTKHNRERRPVQATYINMKQALKKPLQCGKIPNDSPVRSNAV